MKTNRYATSRRDFLKQSTGVLTSSAVVGSAALVRSAHAAGSDQIKNALIGCGGRGVGAARNCLDVRDNIKLVAVADAFQDNARRAVGWLKKAYGNRWMCRPSGSSTVSVPISRRSMRVRIWCCWPLRRGSDRCIIGRPWKPGSTCSWKSPSASAHPAFAWFKRPTDWRNRRA